LVKRYEHSVGVAQQDLALHMQASKGEAASLRRQLESELGAREKLYRDFKEQRHHSRLRSRGDMLALRSAERFTSMLWQFEAWAKYALRAARSRIERHACEVTQCLEHRTREYSDKLNKRTCELTEQLELRTRDFSDRIASREAICIRLGHERLQRVLTYAQVKSAHVLCKLAWDPWRRYAGMLHRERVSGGLNVLRARCAEAEANLRATTSQLQFTKHSSEKNVRLLTMRYGFHSWRASQLLSRSQHSETKWCQIVDACDVVSLRCHARRAYWNMWRSWVVTQQVSRDLSDAQCQLADDSVMEARQRRLCRLDALQEISYQATTLLQKTLFSWAKIFRDSRLEQLMTRRRQKNVPERRRSPASSGGALAISMSANMLRRLAGAQTSRWCRDLRH